jgi:phosphohistidine phosphatase
MKTLYIVRHAKSSWDNPNQADFDRPLNDRGKRDAPRIGKRLKEKRIVIDLLLTSPAQRALSTSIAIAGVLGYPKENIRTDRKLYHASEEDILNVIHTLKDKFSNVMITGHNPGLTDFVNSLLDKFQSIDNIPTCGVVAFTFETTCWKDASQACATFVFFEYPKNKQP